MTHWQRDSTRINIMLFEGGECHSSLFAAAGKPEQEMRREK